MRSSSHKSQLTMPPASTPVCPVVLDIEGNDQHAENARGSALIRSPA
jgi:hypothetical protein